MTTTDLIITGSGPGDYRAADYVAKNGLWVLVFEELEAGDTCLNSGCIPAKYLAHDTSRESMSAFELVMERKRRTIQQLEEDMQTLFSQPNITLVRDKTIFKGHRTMIANGEEYQAEHIIIATGSHTEMPPVKGLVYRQGGKSSVVTSTGLLDTDHVPGKLCIVGVEVIGIEFASVSASLSSKVTVVKFVKECLPTFDNDIAKHLHKCIEKKGIKFYLQAGMRYIHEGKVIFGRKGKELTVEIDTILIATGHAVNMDLLDLDTTDISYDKKGILVDDNIETPINGIYAIGDTNARRMFAHAATFQGFGAVNHTLGKSDNIRFDIIPAAVFAHPKAASVSKVEDTCKTGRLNYTVRKGYYHANGRALSMEESEGMMKLIVDEQNKIIDCHIYGTHATESVQEASVLVNMNITLNQLRDVIHTHPTLGEVLQDMATGQEGRGNLQGPINLTIGGVRRDWGYRVHLVHHGT